MTIRFQQNLNHYYVQNPGHLDASFAVGQNPQEGDFQSLGSPIADYNAMNEVKQTNFTITAVVPNIACEFCVLRLRYVSNNPLEEDHGRTFYQCSDIKIRKGEDDAPKSIPLAVTEPEPQLSKSNPMGCCTMPQWEGRFYETGSWRHPTIGYIAYDATNQFMRVDTVSGSGRTIYDGTFRMYMNFTSGIEWYYNPATGHCGAYGLDYWNDWCYGTPGQSETFLESIQIGGTTANVWQNGDFFFTASQDSCVPMVFNRPATGSFTIYYNVTAGISDRSVFVPPTTCHLPDGVESLDQLQKMPNEHRAFLKHPVFA